MRIRAYAKINLTLDILGVREDGYHELDSLFQSISIYDTIDILDGSGTGIELACVPAPDGENIVMKAARMFFQQAGINPPVDISVRKFVPFRSGLAGGSANAAAVLRGLDLYYNANLEEATLRSIALRLGADVPFFLSGGTCRATGVGERLKYIKMPRALHYVVLKPFMGMSTEQVYRLYDADPSSPRPDTDAAEKALLAYDLKSFAQYAANVLEPATRLDCPEIANYKSMLYHSGAIYACMSGSGSSVFGLFENESMARAAANELKPRTHFCTYACSMQNPIVIQDDLDRRVGGQAMVQRMEASVSLQEASI